MPGLPIGTRAELTDKQAAFINFVLDGTEPRVAAERARYVNGVQAASTLLRTPSVQMALATELNRRLVTEAAPLAYRTLVELTRSTAVPAAVRRNCARDLLDRAGYVPPRPAEQAADAGKAPAEMTTAELHELVGKLEGELAGRATPIGADGVQGSVPVVASRLTFLD